MPASLFPLLLAIHIGLAIALVLPSIVLPFALRGAVSRGRAAPSGGQAEGAPRPAGSLVGALLFLQAHGTVVIGAGLAITGLALVSILGSQLLSQPWLLVALAVYAANLVLAFFVQRPNLRRLLRWRGGDDQAWRARARRQRYVAYTMAGLVGVIGFLMSTKPALW